MSAGRPPFRVQDIGEIAIRCSDLETMFTFYRDMLGLDVLRPPQGGIAFFRTCEGFEGHTRVLALFGPGSVRNNSPIPASGSLSSLHHFALNIPFSEQEAALDWLESRGITTRTEIFGWIGWRGVFFEDPEGNTIELVAFHPDLKVKPA